MKQVLAVIFVVIAAAALYVGTYLPYKKAKATVTSLENFGKAQTISELKDILDTSITYKSPVGNNETIEKITEALIIAIERWEGDNPEAIYELVAYVEGINQPLQDRGKGIFYVRHTYELAKLNHIAWRYTKDETFNTAAEQYYQRCLALSPRRPQCLYGLFDIYSQSDDTTILSQALTIGNEIKQYWPTSPQIKDILKILENRIED